MARAARPVVVRPLRLHRHHDGRLRSYGSAGYARSLLELARAIEREEIDELSDFVGLLGQLFRPGDLGTARAADYSVDVTGRVTDDVLVRQARWRLPRTPSFDEAGTTDKPRLLRELPRG